MLAEDGSVVRAEDDEHDEDDGREAPDEPLDETEADEDTLFLEVTAIHASSSSASSRGGSCGVASFS